ncbi:YfcE family phosphodiesterase [Candidatus Parcubacteria bacterium]|nr:YfcE family phosphodiesterase [Candidatus Parcubacteria bacterium]
MKIAIISDTHDNLGNLEKFLNFAKKEKIEILIHCGDVTKGETLKEIEENFEGQIFLALGNGDIKDSLFEKSKKTKIFEEVGEIEIEKLKIGFCHKVNLKKAKEKIEKFDFFFFGHLHFPFLKKIKNCFVANPGNLAGIIFKASFAILDSKTKKLELKILEKLK